MTRTLTLLLTLCITTAFSQGNNNCEKVYTIVEVQPEYKGGTGALLRDMNKNVLPELECMGANRSLITSLRIRFVVDKKGSVRDVTFPNESALTALCKSKLEKKILVMKWIPGKQEGMPVCVAYILPIRCIMWE